MSDKFEGRLTAKLVEMVKSLSEGDRQVLIDLTQPAAEPKPKKQRKPRQALGSVPTEEQQ